MLTRVSADPADGPGDRFVFVLELSGRPDTIGVDRAFDAILRYGREPGARVIVDVAGVSTCSAIQPMLAAAREVLNAPVTILGAY